MDKTIAILPAAGSGRRMGSDEKKQYLDLCGEPMVLRTARIFDRLGIPMLLLAPPGEVDTMRWMMEEGGIEHVVAVLPGGKTRQASIENALGHIDVSFQKVLVHDAARCLVTQALIRSVVAALDEKSAVIPVIEVLDTIKEKKSDHLVDHTLDRKKLVAVQTPQGFSREVLLEAYAVAREEGLEATDDASLVEAMGHPVHLITGEVENIKITRPLDFQLAQLILKDRKNPCA